MTDAIRGFGIRWALASLLGLIIGIAGFVATGVLAGDALDRLPGFVFGVVLGIVFGGSFGVAQWWVLRRHLRPAAGWIVATLVGFSIAGAIIFGLLNGSEPDTPLITKLGHGILLGAALGIAQWSVLRGKLGGTAPWIAISVVAWVVAELVGVALTGLVGPPVDLLGLFLVGAVLPGVGMRWLLDRSGSATTAQRMA